MNEWFKKLFGQIKELWGKWTVVQKVILIGIVVVAIGAIILVSTISSKPTTVPLYSVAITDQAVLEKIVLRLDQEGVETWVSAAGIISVKDSATARRMRTILIREDLTPGNVDPWSMFDNLDRWTTNDLEQDVAKQRALTEQVRQHVMSLEEIDNANLVITFPDQNVLFSSDRKPVTASLVLYNKPGSDILENKSKIQGIQKLLLYAVEGLTAENVTIVDSYGSILNDFDGMKDIERVDVIAKQQKLISQLEAQYRVKILNSLQQIFTSDRVRDLNIKIDMDMSEKSIDSVVYSPITIKEDNPDTPYDDSELINSLPISSETVEKVSKGTVYNPEGPAGVEGQNPPVYSDMSNAYTLTEEKGQKVNNVINTSQISEQRSPTIDRVTVSVNIDGTWQRSYNEKGELIINPNGSIAREYVPVDQAVLTQAQQLVQNAIGYNRTRGDSVSVQNIQFDRTIQFSEEDGSYMRKIQTQKTIIYVCTGIATVLLAFIIFRFISRELERKRRLKEEELLRKHQMDREKTLWEAEQAGMEVTMSVEERERAELLENAFAMAKEHPEDVAMLIRTWLMEE